MCEAFGNPTLRGFEVAKDRVVGTIQGTEPGLEIPVASQSVVKRGEADEHRDELLVVRDEAALAVAETGGHTHRMPRQAHAIASRSTSGLRCR
jgi:hypothetical protein